MAKVIKKRLFNSVKAKYYKCYLLVFLYAVVIISLCILAFKTKAISLIGIPFFVLLIRSTIKKANILKPGFAGESKTVKILSKLPGGYYVLPDLEILVEGKTCQTDNIVICKSGVFVIETKNHIGLIEGKDVYNELTQTKIIEGHKTVRKQFYNPIKQVDTHCYLVSKLLRNNGYRISVQGIVFFSNKEAVVKVDCAEIPVFAAGKGGAKKMKRFIKRYSQGKKLSDSDVVKIKDIIIDNSN